MAEPLGNNGNPEATTGAGVLNDVWDQFRHILRTSDGAAQAQVAAKTITFTGAANLGAIGALPLFTVTGDVLVALTAVCNTTLAGASATIVHGTAGTTNLLIASLTATTIVQRKAIDSTGLVLQGVALAKTPLMALFSENIIGTVATAAITGGVLDYLCYWIPLSAGATVS